MTTSAPVSHYPVVDGFRFHVVEWPGEGDPLLLFHATGFHARCWDEIVRMLPGRHVYAVDMPAHGQSDRLPLPLHWDVMGKLLAGLVRQLDLHEITGVGHSFGGHMMVRVAALEPERFRQLLLLDPVIAAPELLRLWQQSGAASPIARRRNVWASPEEMFAALEGRVPYNTWQKRVLQDFCTYGLVRVPGQEHYSLACPPECEASVYENVGSESIYDLMPRVTANVRIVRARSRTADDALFDFRPSPTWPQLAQQFAYAQDVQLTQDHFFPMSEPEIVVGQLQELA